MLATQGGGERETGRGPDALVGQRECRAQGGLARETAGEGEARPPLKTFAPMPGRAAFASLLRSYVECIGICRSVTEFCRHLRLWIRFNSRRRSCGAVRSRSAAYSSAMIPSYRQPLKR
jgi:hypothetical protein